MLLSIVIVFLTVIFIIKIQDVKSPLLQKCFNWFPPILFAYMIPALITHTFNLNLANSEIHIYSKGFIIPLTILSVMSALSLSQLKIVGIKPIVLFVSGSFIIATLPPILIFLLRLLSPDLGIQIINEELWKGLVTIVGSWIGGSTSQLVLKEVVECSEELFAAILVIDNILVNIWTILMFQFIKRSDQINNYFGISSEKPPVSEFEDAPVSKIQSGLTIMIVSLISFSFFFIGISFLSKIILLSIIGLALGNLIKNWDHKIILKVGSKLILIIMATLGLKLNFNSLGIPSA